MKKPLSRLARASEPGYYSLSTPCHHKLRGKLLSRLPCSANKLKLGLAGLGAVLLLLLLAQGSLISTFTGTKPLKVDIGPVSSSSGATGGTDSPSREQGDSGHLVLLDTLWAALPFTHAVKHHSGHTSRTWQLQAGVATHTQQRQQQPAVQHEVGAPYSASSRNSSSSIGSSRSSSSSTGSSSQQPGTSEHLLPSLRLPSNLELLLLHRLAAAVLDSGLPEALTREAFLAAFQAVPPPRGFPAWQARLPPDPNAAAAAEAEAQQRQHKGAQYITVDEGEGEPSFNLTPADLTKLRPRGARTLSDEAAIAAAAAAATAFLANVSSPQQLHPHHHQQQWQREPGGGVHDASILQGKAAAELLLQYGLLLLKASHQLAPCAVDDASLPIDRLMGVPGAPRVLLAITGAAEGPGSLPNLVLQLVQLVLQSQPGSLYLSLVDDTAAAGSSSISSSSSSTGSSSSTAAYFLDILQLLLAPLQVPVLVTRDSRLADLPAAFTGSSRGMQRSIMQAAARNAAIEPFFAAQGSSSSSGCAAHGQGPSESAGDFASSSSSASDSLPAPETEGLLQHEDLTAAIDSGSTWEQQQKVSRALLSRMPPRSSFLASKGAVAAEQDSSSSDQDYIAAAIAAATVTPISSRSSRNHKPLPALQPSSPACFNPDWVVFVQASTLFCKSDVQRLLMHTGADLTCGMDMHVAEPSPEPQPQEQTPPAAAAAAAAAVTEVDAVPAAVTVEALRRQLMQLQQHQGRNHTRHLQASDTPTAAASAAVAAAAEVWHERPPALDVWKHPVVYAGAAVGRMVNGQPFSAAPFFAGGHAPTLRRVVAGLPVQVHCCWSGLTKLSAHAFAAGLRFRAEPMPGECSSAVSPNLLCDDMHRTGFARALIDAGVLLSHDPDVAAKFTPLIKAADRAPYIRRSRWVEVQGAGSPWELDADSLRDSYRATQCCQEPQQQDEQQQQQQQQQLLIVDEMVQAVAASSRPGGPLPLRGWDASGCHAVDALAHNHTEAVLQRLHAAQT